MKVRSQRARKRPITLNVFQLPGDRNMRFLGVEWPDWIERAVDAGTVWLEHETLNQPTTFCIKTLEGVMRGVSEDWIIQGVQGELYPCKADIFAATYDLVEGEVQE